MFPSGPGGQRADQGAESVQLLLDAVPLLPLQVAVRHLAVQPQRQRARALLQTRLLRAQPLPLPLGLLQRRSALCPGGERAQFYKGDNTDGVLQLLMRRYYGAAMVVVLR